MLSPDSRCLYTDALSPPYGYEFECGVATTYSLDVTTLLTIPIQLVLSSKSKRTEMFEDGVALLDSLRRTVSSLCVFCERGRIKVPGKPNLLYSMLEQVIVEALAPRGGAFHPKVWFLKYSDSSGKKEALYRLLVLSRNITSDRTWDVALVMDGHAVEKPIEANLVLCDFIKALPGLAVGEVSDRTSDICKQLASEAAYLKWQLPSDFRGLSFHLLGLKNRRKTWLPPKSSSLVVVSPFVSSEALNRLASTSQEPLAIISSSNWLDSVEPAVIEKYDQILVLDEAARSEEGEEEADVEIGLHAKLYIFREWYNTHIVLGSANATNAALLNGSNVEFLAEIWGKDKAIGKPETFLCSEDGLGEYLVEYSADKEHIEDSEPDASKKHLEDLRRRILSSDLRVRCSGSKGKYNLVLNSRAGISFSENEIVAIWPISVISDLAISLETIQPGGSVQLPGVDITSLTGFIAFEIRVGREEERFVLNLPLDDIPEDRETAILRTIINNREGFIRYLRMLLGGIGGDAWGDAYGSGSGSWLQRFTKGHSALLAEFVLALSRDPERLKDVARLVDDLSEPDSNGTVFPEGFLEFWSVFEDAIKKGGK